VDRKKPIERILVVGDGKRGPGATQMISFGQPFDARHGPTPARVNFEIDYSDVEKVREAFASHQPDVLILSRCTTPRGLEWIRLAREAHLPVLFHIDDDLLAVPPSLGEAKFKAYNDPARLAALRANIEACDLLYASNPTLAARLKEHELNVSIVAADIYCSISPSDIGALKGQASGPVIGYMGTSGHGADLAMILPAIEDAMDALPTLRFEVFGTIEFPARLTRFGRRVRHLAPVQNYGDFLPFLRSIGWWVGLAPLEDNMFNWCKSDTKWVEYSVAGMAVIASDVPVYERACSNGAGVLCRTIDDWREAILSMLLDHERRNSSIAAAQSKLAEHYSHQRLQAQVLQVIDRARQSQS
jgi:glycosyltransferase involved in cell wall biosynthesis